MNFRLALASSALLLRFGCGSEKAKSPPVSRQEAAPQEPAPPVDAGPPLAPQAIPSDMVLIPERGGTEAFYLDVNEVTVRDYDECVHRGACKPPSTTLGCDGLVNNYANKRSLHPVNCVSEIDGWRFCRYRDKRLPTWNEYESAFKSGGAKYPWGKETPTCARAVIAGCGDAGTSPVGSKPGGRNPQGVQDLIGNVAEIEGTNREMDFDFYMMRGRTPGENVWVIGGGYATKAGGATMSGFATIPGPEVGFRCASSLPGTPQIGSR